jgi:YHS domain-containing protein
MKYLTMIAALVVLLLTAGGASAEEGYTQKQLQAAAKACGSVNGLCPVKGRLVEPKWGSSSYKGEKIAFSCAACAATFNADPTRYMDRMRLDPPKYWYASALPSVTQMRAAKKAVGSANGRCPVMGKAVVPTGTFSTYQGQKIQFCCPPCKAKFDRKTEKYMRILRADPLAYAYDRPGPTNAQLHAARKASGSVNGLCPVLKKTVAPAAGTFVYRKQKIGFASAEALKKFQASPETYMAPMRAEPAVYGYLPATGK